MKYKPLPIRYTSLPLPLKKYIPGKGIHPKKDPKSFRVFQIEFSDAKFNPTQWENSDKYLYAIDLFNYGYWWEAHEILELLWIETGRSTDTAKFFQGLIQIAAALLRNNHSSEIPPILTKAFDNISKQTGVFMGIDIEVFINDIEMHFNKQRSEPPIISLIIE